MSPEVPLDEEFAGARPLCKRFAFCVTDEAVFPSRFPTVMFEVLPFAPLTTTRRLFATAPPIDGRPEIATAVFDMGY